MARNVRIATAGTPLLVLVFAGLGACGGEVEASNPGSSEAIPPTVELEFPPLGRPASALGEAESPHVTPERPPRAPSAARPGKGAPRLASPLEDSLDRPAARILAEARQRALDASKGRCLPQQTTIAVECVDLTTGVRLLSHGAEQPMIPASNLKVITAGAALLGLGIDAAFETSFEAIGRVQEGRLEGDLVVRAGADPMHRREGDGNLAPWFDRMAADLRAAGIESISGDVVLDHGPFVPLGTGPEWPDSRQHWQQYCGLASGFSANGGAYRVTVSSGAENARVVLRPRNHGLARRGRVDVGGKKNDLRVGANGGGVTVGGQVPANFGPFVREFRHPDPDRLFASALRGALADRGIRCGRVVMPGDPSPARSRRGTTVHVMRSPLSSILEAVLGDSNNPVSDQLFALIGGRMANDGSREGSAGAILRILTEHRIDVAGLVQVEGSGLSRANRVSARTLCDVHAAVAADPALVPMYVDALLRSGVDEKLGDRMAGTPAEGRVVAKTGWIGGASSFSGLVLDDSGSPRLAFAILVGYPRVAGLNTKAWKPMQDELCALFASSIAAGSPR